MPNIITHRILSVATVLLLTATSVCGQVAKERWTDLKWTNGTEALASYPLGGSKVLMAAAGFFDAGYGYLFDIKEDGKGGFLMQGLMPDAVELPEDFGYMGINEPDEDRVWERQTVGGIDVILQKRRDGTVYDAYSPLMGEDDMGFRAVENLKILLCGKNSETSTTYTTRKGEKYSFTNEGFCTMEGKNLNYTIGYEEAMPVQIIELTDGRVFWFEPTPAGIDLYNTRENKYIEGSYEKATLYKSLIASKDAPRWEYLSDMVADQNMICINPQVLKLMRNEIFARKGYVFSNPELNKYFRSCAWYKPLDDNSKVKLTPIEQLNVALIKYQEQNQLK